MKNYKTIIAAVAAGVALAATERSAEASFVTAYLTQGTGLQPVLQVQYQAVDTTLWTYTYIITVGTLSGSVFTPTTANPVDSFTVDAMFVNPGSATSLNSGAPFIHSTSVDWNYATPVNTDTVSFTSAFGPALGGASGNDGAPSVAWSAANPGGNPVAVPVPEPSTVVAGALMLLPFGIGAIRSLRKDRTA